MRVVTVNNNKKKSNYNTILIDFTRIHKMQFGFTKYTDHIISASFKAYNFNSMD